MIIYISEFIGTFMYVFLTQAIISNAINDRNRGHSILVTSLGVALSYTVPCILFGDISGAHFNPAITIATAVLGIFEIRFMLGYLLCEAAGAFLASLLYRSCFKNKFYQATDIDVRIKLFITKSSETVLMAFIKEVLATFFIVFGMIGVTFILKAVETESVYLLYFLVIFAVGLAFDFTEVSTNPFRDLFHRLFLLPQVLKNEVKNKYIIATTLGPLVGAMIAVILYKLIPWYK